MIKKTIISMAFAVFAFSGVANAELNDSQRDEMFKVIKEDLYEDWPDPAIRKCWSSAKSGNDKSLSALFLMAKSKTIIKTISEKRAKIIHSTKSKVEMSNKIKESFSMSDFNNIKNAIAVLPKANEYCQKL